MASVIKASAVLDNVFLTMRHRLLDIAAALDRIDRAADVKSAQSDPRMRMLREAVAVLTDGKPDRAVRAQMTFSIPYNDVLH